MRWFVNIATRDKLLMSFGLLIVLMGIVIVTASQEMNSMAKSEKTLLQRDFALAFGVAVLTDHEDRVRSDVLAMLTLDKPADREPYLQDIKEKIPMIQDILRSSLAIAEKDQTSLPKLAEFQAVQMAYDQARDQEVIPLIEAGKLAEAGKLVKGIQQGRFRKMQAIITEVGTAAGERAQAGVAASERTFTHAVRIFTAMGIGALLLTIGVVVILNRIIAGPLHQISSAAQRVASGNLSVELPAYDRTDEVGKLILTFRQMVARLRTTNKEVREGVTVLASTASQILATTTQIAGGAMKTVAAVSETTTTVEEVKQTALVSSQKAKYVSESAQRTAQTAQAGKKSAEHTIEGMNRIRQQMELVADSIIRLSEQGQAIGEIIANVNDLADQSNLLAVNAAIEAAKAGEQGRGFAVVAQEVKSLALQSKQATAQVRSILGDIQKATAAAVMATEQGNSVVETGVKQSTQVSESVQRLAESIAEATQAALQIAASAQQQLAGMDQVALAMENIRQVCTENSASTQQAELSAQNLHALGQKLQGMVEQFQV